MPQKYKIRGLKYAFHCLNADRASDLLPGGVHVAGTEIRDLLQGLCCSHLLDFASFWVLFCLNY